MRGKVKDGQQIPANVRITPAHAGKSIELALAKDYNQDHPRTCGEKSPFIGKGIELRGSPPHMRGKGFFSSADFSVERITPAHAGKSPRR